MKCSCVQGLVFYGHPQKLSTKEHLNFTTKTEKEPKHMSKCCLYSDLKQLLQPNTAMVCLSVPIAVVDAWPVLNCNTHGCY